MSDPSQTATSISLEVINGPHDGERLVSNKSEICFGRAKRKKGAPESDLALPRDLLVSGSHGKVFFDNGRWMLVDRRSSNGTHIGGAQIGLKPPGEKPEPHELNATDYFVVGNTVIEFCASPRPVPTVEKGLRPTGSPESEELLRAAREEAIERDADYVTSEHLFGALAGAAITLVDEFFAGAKVDGKQAASEALDGDRWTGEQAWIGGKDVLHQKDEKSAKDGARQGDSKTASRNLKTTPRLNRTMALAEKARIESGAPAIEAMHLLTAILREGGGRPVAVLRSMGVDCDRLAQLAFEITRDHYMPEEDEREESQAGDDEATGRFARPKIERRPVDHNAWVAARTLMDDLLATQVRFQLAEPTVRFDALRGKIREGLEQSSPKRREGICEQLRLLFPISGDTGEFEFPTTDDYGPADEIPIEEGATGSIPEKSAAREDDRPIGPAGRGTDVIDLLDRIFGAENLEQTFGVDADDDFLKLTKYFYEFGLDIEHLIKGVLQNPGGSGESVILLPFQVRDIKMMIHSLLKEKDPKSAEEISGYLNDLGVWMVALMTAIEKGSGEWNRRIWDRISPKAIKEDCNVRGALVRFSKGTLWDRFEAKARDMTPEILNDEFQQMIQTMTTQEYTRLSRQTRRD